MYAIDLLKKYEGLSLTAYKCPAGIWTIGFGATFYADGTPVKQGDKITLAQAEQLLLAHYKSFEDSVKKLVSGCQTSDNELQAMACLAYNIGMGNFGTSSVLKFHKLGKKDQAASSFMLWNKAKVNGVLTELKGLTLRRKSESTLYLTV